MQTRSQTRALKEEEEKREEEKREEEKRALLEEDEPILVLPKMQRHMYTVGGNLSAEEFILSLKMVEPYQVVEKRRRPTNFMSMFEWIYGADL